jgi:hypothetical protein
LSNVFTKLEECRIALDYNGNISSWITVIYSYFKNKAMSGNNKGQECKAVHDKGKVVQGAL